MSARLSRHLKAAAVIGSIAGLTAVCVPASAAPATPKTTTVPAAAAAGWLAGQLVGGTHLTLSFSGQTYPDYGGTADAVFALAAAKSGGTAITAATAWLAENLDAYASISTLGQQPGAYDGSIAKLALVAQVTGGDPTDFGGHNLLQALRDDECTAAANADDKDTSAAVCPAAGAARNIFSSVSESLAILVEARAGGDYAPTAAATSYFLSLQCPNGGFTQLTTACTDNKDASPDETGYAAMALEALGTQSAALQKAVSWLTAQRASGGYWVAQGGPDVDSTGVAAAALDGAGVDTASSRHWLGSQQVTTGPTIGAKASRGALTYQGKFDPSASAKATADGLLGMAAHGSLATLTDQGTQAGTAVLALARPSLGKATLARGGQQTVSGTGFAAGEKVSAVLHSSPVTVGSATADASGTVRLSFTVPATAALGDHTVVLTGETSGLSSTTTPFAVSAAAAASGPSTTPTTAAAGSCDPAELACTGRSDALMTELAVGALILLIMGGALTWFGRRRLGHS